VSSDTHILSESEELIAECDKLSECELSGDEEDI